MNNLRQIFYRMEKSLVARFRRKNIDLPKTFFAQQPSSRIVKRFGLFSKFEFLPDALEPFGSFENVGGNTFRFEALAAVDLELQKTPGNYQKLRLEFRAEAANLFDPSNFGLPDPITENAFILFATTTGVLGSAKNPGFNNGGSQTLRFGLRLLF